MKSKSIILSLIINLFITYMAKTQVSSSIAITQNDISFKHSKGHDELVIMDYSFTEEIGNPQLPTLIESFVVPYDAIVSGLHITFVTKQKVKAKFYIYPTQPQRPLDGNILVSLLINQS
jgi:hypothetical protein